MTRSRGPRSSLLLAERAVLAAFAGADVRTRAQLIQSTGLSRAVVAGVVETLVGRGELTEVEQQPAAGTRGRPSARYRRSALLAPVLLIRLRKDAGTTVSVVEADGSSPAALTGQAWDAPWERWAAATREIAARVTEAAAAPPRMVVIAAPFPVREGEGQPRSHPLPPGSRNLLKPRPPRPGWLACDPRPAIAGLLRCQVIMVTTRTWPPSARLVSAPPRPTGASCTCLSATASEPGSASAAFCCAGASGFAGELAQRAGGRSR